MNLFAGNVLMSFVNNVDVFLNDDIKWKEKESRLDLFESNFLKHR